MSEERDGVDEELHGNLLDLLEHALIRQLGVELARLVAAGEYESADRLSGLAIGLAHDIASSGIAGIVNLTDRGRLFAAPLGLKRAAQ
jgi:hypothetical protein